MSSRPEITPAVSVSAAPTLTAMAAYTRGSSLAIAPARSNASPAPTSAALNRITARPSGSAPKAGQSAALVRGTVSRTERARMRGRLGLGRVRGGSGGLTVTHVGAGHGRGHRLRTGPHRAESAGVRRSRFEVAEQAFQVRLEPAAVLTLKRPQVIDPALEFFTLLNERAHGLTVPLLSVPLQALGARPGVAGDLLGLPACLAQDVVRLAAGPSERLVRFAPRVGDGLVGGLLGEGQDACRGVHVVLGRGDAHHHRLGLPALRLGTWRLGRSHQLGLRLGARRAERRGRGLATAHELSQLGPELLVLLQEPVKLGLDLVEEGVNLFLVVAGPEPGGTELLVPTVRGRQRHIVSLARLECPTYGTVLRFVERPHQPRSESRRTAP